MKKEALEKELFTVLEEAQQLQEKSEMVLATAEFLRNEGDKLMRKFDDSSVSYEEKELIGKQMDALKLRVDHELRSFEADCPRLNYLENRLQELKQICESSSFEE